MYSTLRAASTASVIAFLLAAFGTVGQADSGTATPVVVELFTSEGCSSCPPAETLLRTMDAKQPVAGVQLVVLEEHVDYWDDQGWKDPFSSHDFTVRQQAYAENLGARGPYTPEMVVDGSFEFVGSDVQKADAALEKARLLPMIGVRLSSVTVANGAVHGVVQADPSPAKADVYVALALEHAESQVLRGENGGRHLEHVAVVERLVRVGKAANGQAFSHEFSLPLKFGEQPFRIIALVQRPGEGKILGATVERIGSTGAPELGRSAQN
jgi:hypothetical protein